MAFVPSCKQERAHLGAQKKGAPMQEISARATLAGGCAAGVTGCGHRSHVRTSRRPSPPTMTGTSPSTIRRLPEGDEERAALRRVHRRGSPGVARLDGRGVGPIAFDAAALDAAGVRRGGAGHGRSRSPSPSRRVRRRPVLRPRSRPKAFGPSSTAAPAASVTRPDDRATPRPVPVSVSDAAVRPDDRVTPRPVPTLRRIRRFVPT